MHLLGVELTQEQQSLHCEAFHTERRRGLVPILVLEGPADSLLVDRTTISATGFLDSDQSSELLLVPVDAFQDESPARIP